MDPVYWRHPAFYPDLDYTLFEDFPKTLELANDQLVTKIPELELQPKKYLLDPVSCSAYYLSATSKWTYRVWLPIYRAFGDEDGMAPHSKIRQSKFYDSSGRVNKSAYGRLLAAMNQNRVKRNKLDQYLKDPKCPNCGAKRE